METWSIHHRISCLDEWFSRWKELPASFATVWRLNLSSFLFPKYSQFCSVGDRIKDIFKHPPPSKNPEEAVFQAFIHQSVASCLRLEINKAANLPAEIWAADLRFLWRIDARMNTTSIGISQHPLWSSPGSASLSQSFPSINPKNSSSKQTSWCRA